MVSLRVSPVALRRDHRSPRRAGPVRARVGAANRVFERLYAIRLAMKRLKKRNRTAYYVLSYGSKLAAAGGLLYVALF